MRKHTEQPSQMDTNGKFVSKTINFAKNGGICNKQKQTNGRACQK